MTTLDDRPHTNLYWQYQTAPWRTARTVTAGEVTR